MPDHVGQTAFLHRTVNSGRTARVPVVILHHWTTPESQGYSTVLEWCGNEAVVESRRLHLPPSPTQTPSPLGDCPERSYPTAESTARIRNMPLLLRRLLRSAVKDNRLGDPLHDQALAIFLAAHDMRATTSWGALRDTLRYGANTNAEIDAAIRNALSQRRGVRR